MSRGRKKKVQKGKKEKNRGERKKGLKANEKVGKKREPPFLLDSRTW